MTIAQLENEKKIDENGSEREKELSAKQFLEHNVPEFRGSTSYVIKDLWGNNFRINYYKKDTKHVIQSSHIIGSYFISVIKSPDGYFLKNHTIEDIIPRKEIQ